MSIKALRPLTAALAALALASVAACGGPSDAPATAGEPATEGVVVSYNSPEQFANWGEVLRSFTAATGITAPNDPKNSGQTIAALQAEAAAPVADTAYYGIVFGYQAAEAGLVEPYRPPGFDEIPAPLKDPDGEWFTVHQGAVAMLVNTDELDGAPVPRCWSDLTRPEYAGKVGYLDPTQAAIGYSVLTAANLALGGTLQDPGPGIAWAAALRANGAVNPAQTATAAVQQGEIPILIDADFNGYKLALDDGAPIEVVYPCEGSLAIPYVMSLVRGAPHPRAARALLDYALGDEGQSLFAESYLRPVRDVPLPPELEGVGLPAEEYERLVTVPDYAEMQAAQAAVVERWTSEVAS